MGSYRKIQNQIRNQEARINLRVNLTKKAIITTMLIMISALIIAEILQRLGMIDKADMMRIIAIGLFAAIFNWIMLVRKLLKLKLITK